MRVNACRLTAACTPSTLDSELCQLSLADCQLALPWATALLLIYTHSNFWASDGGGGGGVTTIRLLLVGIVGGDCPMGFAICVVVGAGYTITGAFISIGVVRVVVWGGDFIGALAILSMVICALDSRAVSGIFWAVIRVGRVFAAFSSASAIYLSMMQSLLSTDSEVETVSM
jgi:hypothetical protein